MSRKIIKSLRTMSQELNDYLNSLNHKGYRFHTEDVIGSNFYYLFLKKDKAFRLLMNGEETPQDIGEYLLNRYNYSI